MPLHGKNMYLIIRNLENIIELSFSFLKIHTSIFSGGIIISVQPFNGKLIEEEKIKVFFSEGFEGAVALYVDFFPVYGLLLL
mgnify:CR=1 FL=1